MSEAAAMEDTPNLALTIFVTLNVKNSSAVSDCSFNFARNHDEANNLRDSRIYATLWTLKQVGGLYVGQHPNRHMVLRIILILAGNIKTCPGPLSKCNICNKTFHRNHSSAADFVL